VRAVLQEDVRFLIANELVPQLHAMEKRLGERLQSATEAKSTPTDQLLTARELADLLRVSLKTIRRWRVSGQLPPPVEIAGTLRWERVVIDRWYQNLKVAE